MWEHSIQLHTTWIFVLATIHPIQIPNTLSLFKRIGIGELKPTEVTLKLADRTTVCPVGFVEDIPVKIEGIYILADFFVVDIDEDSQVHVLLHLSSLWRELSLMSRMVG